MRRATLAIAFWLGCAGIGWLVGPEIAHYFECGYSRAVAQAPGQDGEDGNPGHVEPTKQCSHRPNAQQVACKCARSCNPDGSASEDRKCKSWCWRRWCACPDPLCP